MSNWTVIKAKVPSLAAVVAPFEKEMNHFVDLVEKSFVSTTATWGHKVIFDKEVKTDGEFGGMTSVTGTVSTDNQIYGYINDGTSVRYATMTQGFKAKTKPGRIRSGAGSGGVNYVDRRRPRPGIKPRKFDELIAKGKERNFILAFDRAVKAAIKVLDNP